MLTPQGFRGSTRQACNVRSPLFRLHFCVLSFQPEISSNRFAQPSPGPVRFPWLSTSKRKTASQMQGMLRRFQCSLDSLFIILPLFSVFFPLSSFLSFFCFCCLLCFLPVSSNLLGHGSPQSLFLFLFFLCVPPLLCWAVFGLFSHGVAEMFAKLCLDIIKLL